MHWKHNRKRMISYEEEVEKIEQNLSTRHYVLEK